MPFTLAHPAAVLVLRRTGVPLTALAAGSMAPDLPLFAHGVPGVPSYALTHSLRGVLTVDVVVAAVAVLVWVGLLRDALVDAAPGALRERLEPSVRWTRLAWLLTPVGGVLGAATHVVWDDFTHPHRWGVDRIAALHAQHGPLMGSAWAQYTSGALGLTAITLWSLAALRRLPRRSRPRQVTGIGTMTAVAAAGILTAVVARALPRVHDGLHAVAYRCGVTGVAALALAAVLLALAWHALRPRSAAVH